MFKLSIKTKLFVLVVSVLIPLISLQTIRIKDEFNNSIQRELNASEKLAEAISTSFTNYIQEVWVQESIIGSHVITRNQLSTAEIQTSIVELHKNQPTLLELAWINPQGLVVASSRDEMIGKSITQRNHFQRILSGEEKVISNLELSLVDKQPIIIITRAIKEGEKLIGVVCAVIDVNEISNRLPNYALGAASRIGLIDRNGMMVYRSDQKQIPYDKRKISDTSPAWMALKGEVVRTVKRSSGIDSTTRMGVDYPIKELGWDCFVTTSYEMTMAEHYLRLKRDIIVLVGISLMSILAAYLLGKKLLKPLTHIQEVASAIRAGDYTARTNIYGYDELAATAEAFDSMAENIEKYDKMKSQFFTNLSHELKTPLAVMLASIQLIENIEPLAKVCPNHNKIDKQMKVVKQNSYRLIRMINNLIDVSRYDNGYLKIKMGNYNIVSIIEEITMSVVKFAESKGISIIFDTDVEEKVIACDPDMIERIILNLLSNSIKFTNKGGSILVSIFDGHESIMVSIKDTGMGIPKDKLSLIFERFIQVDSNLNRSHEGSGIGLAIVKSLVEAHKGTIKVLSEIGQGTEMIIELPIYTIRETVDNNIYEATDLNNQSFVEKVNIEFSDIYELHDIE